VILISAQFNISPHYSIMVQNQITVLLCLKPLLFGCRVLHIKLVYCEAVRWAIIGTVWLLVYLMIDHHFHNQL